MSRLLHVDRLHVDYTPGDRVVHAVQDLSLSVDSGQVVGLAGESGSGKSTLALAILRLIRPQEGRIVSGQIFFEGQDLLKRSEESMRHVRGKRIAMIFQDPFTSLNPVLRIREQLLETLDAHGLGREGDARVREVLAQVNLGGERIVDAYPHQLSGGQRQRVLIASALLCRPALLLADEPTTALDVLVQHSILDLLFDVRAQMGVAMVFISHNLSLMAQRTQRLMILQHGQRVEEGETDQLLRHPQHAYTQELVRAAKRLHRAGS